MEKIIFFLPCFYSPEDKRSTGGTISNYLLVKELLSRYDVTIVAAETSKYFDLDIKLVAGDESISDIYHNNISARLRRVLRWRWINSSFRATKFQEYRYVVLTNGTLISGYKLIDDNKLIILTRAFEDFYMLRDSFGNLLKKKLLQISDNEARKAYRKASLIITNSKFMLSKISDYFEIPKKNIDILYPPISFPEDVKFSFSKNRFNICMINPSPSKGENIFLGLADKFPDFSFSYYSRYDKKYSKNNVKYMGWGGNHCDMFATIDLLLVPSQWEEPFGRVAAEGILYGKPVLVSNRGLPEIVSDYFIVQDDDIDSWGLKIKEIKDDAPMVEEKWNEAVDIAVKFSYVQHNKKLAELFK